MEFLQIQNVTQTSLNFLDRIKEIGFAWGPKLLSAIVIYIIGSWVIKRIVGLTAKVLTAKKYDPSLQTFLGSLIKVVLTILLLITVLGVVGVETSAFAALIAGAGLAIGAALNGSLGNLAGGVMMLIFKPFKVGDLVEAQGQVGTIKEQGIFNTIMLSPDNKTVILPNGPVSTGTIINYSTHGNLRVDLVMAVDPGVSIDKARKVAIDAMLAHPTVLKTPAPEVSVLKVGDGMTTLAIRPYTAQADYWDVYFGVQEAVKNAFDANGVAGPIPHRVIINK
jgi:small conductance mechanosensitive channel